jgi:hypothetical protein
MAALVSEYPVCARCETMEQTLRTEKINVRKSCEEEEAFDTRSEADQVKKELAAMLQRLELVELLNRIHPLHAEVGLFGDGWNILDGSEGRGPLVRVGHIVVEQSEIKLDMDGFFKELPREIQTGLGRVDVFVEIEYEIVRHNAVPSSKESNKPLNHVNLCRRDPLLEIDQVSLKIDLLNSPGVFDAIAKHVIKDRETHGAKR